MYYSPLHFLIEITFNLTLVDDSTWALGGSWRDNDVLQLILSACLWCPMMLSHLSIQSSFPSSEVDMGDITEVLAKPSSLPLPSPAPITTKRASNIVRGRDTPFPTVPIRRRCTIQVPPPNLSNSVLLQRRYSSASLPVVPTACDDDPHPHPHPHPPSRGRTLQRMPAPRARPALSRRSDSRTRSPEAVDATALPRRRVSRNSTLLRVPPFPLPHRVMQRPISDLFSPSPSPPRKVEVVGPRGIGWKRPSLIPPPLVLENIISQRFEEDEGSPALERGRQKARGLRRPACAAVC
ncbi:hypothetical protein D9615_008277 [Tricholomella constricta]|uniref:Uncharacterized protein n=1 Tax=Tricholomella constricta TaxID=117010 RepID=A0A8H5M0A6_9AGAR|nr:hypothetical protein D9615_008277 [Tricholomella constricta]